MHMMHIKLSLHIMMSIGLAALTLIAPPPSTMYILVITSSRGPLSGSQLCLIPLPRLNIGLLLMPSPRLVGFTIFLLSSINLHSHLVYCDNVSGVFMSSTPVQHHHTKHIKIDIHFICEKVCLDEVRVLHMPSTF